MIDNLKQRAIGTLGLIGVALVLLVPTIHKWFISESGRPLDWWQISQPLSLGLDLSGGVSITYQVKAEEAVFSRMQVVSTELRSLLLGRKIPVVRARASKKLGELEVVLYNSTKATEAKNLIEDEYPELEARGRRSSGSQVILTFGIGQSSIDDLRMNAVSRAVESLRARVDQFGVAEPLIQRVGERRILLQMPGYTDIDRVKRVVGKTAKLEFRFVARSPSEPSVLMPSREDGEVRVEERIATTGDKVERARVQIRPEGVSVDLSFTREGSRLFSELSRDNVGRSLAIILDGEVYSAPVIQDQIRGGAAQITGQFSIEEANELSIVLRSGSLPASLVVLDETLVGATLGKEAIRGGVLAILGGFVAILLFMVWYYRLSGVVAVFTLFVNVLVLLACLSLFGAAITLPGLAGLALTIGIAVDSNVIIFERIRDELKQGLGMTTAVDRGFSKAFSAILDTNITGLLTGIILYVFGTGPVRGFAVTLSIGVLTTIIGAVFVAKFCFDYLIYRRKGQISI